MPAKDTPTVEFPDRSAWERWLEANHASSPGVWLKLPKKGSGAGTVTKGERSGAGTITKAEALEEAIRYGWIDGQVRRHDDAFWLQRFTPRGPHSKWSQVNRRKATELIEQGRMRPAGLAQVEAAKNDGRWDAAYAPQSTVAVPDDFQRALDANPEADEFFATLKRSERYSFLYRIYDAKRPETRARRIRDYVAMLADGKTIHGRAGGD